MKPNIISCFNTFVLRTPLYPINFYTQLISFYSSNKLFNVFEDKTIKNAIKIASPELITELEKLLENQAKFNSDKKINLELALLKYIARLSSRATPFGIFAGCSTGILANKTHIQLDSIYAHKVFTQFDMHYWINLLQDIAKNPIVQKELIYYPNTSLYKIADFYRYVEYQFVGKKREHNLSSFRGNSFIDILIENSKNGLKFNDFVDLIVDDESEIVEASEFVKQLIDNQILVSELDATITGDFDIQRVINILKNIPDYAVETSVLNEMKLYLESKVTLQNLRNQLDGLRNLAGKFETEFEEKYLLQTDLHKKAIHASLNKKVSFKISKALQFLSKMQRKRDNNNLINFKNTFQKRYETREMPLSVVLDSELGIGYLQTTRMNDTHSILDNFSFHKTSKTNATSEEWTQIDYILEKKLETAIANSDKEIVLYDNDFDSVLSENQNFPYTFSVMVEVLTKNDEELIVIESSRNISAAKLIGRFCNGDAAIHDLANQIIAKEAELNPNKILAEIVHIPQSRTGNVLKRPNLRAYEIPYLANSILPQENQITIDDLYISIKHNKIILKSKRLKKEIIPCLSNAHNYSYNSLPIYHFLCDLQGQSLETIPNFSWGILENHYQYFPQVLYSGVILSKAKWIFEYDELVTLKHQTFEAFQFWKKSKSLPQYVNLVNGDNTLLLDLNVEIGLRLLLKTIKPNSKIILEEFLFEDYSVVKDVNSNSFANQFILSYYNSN